MLRRIDGDSSEENGRREIGYTKLKDPSMNLDNEPESSDGSRIMNVPARGAPRCNEIADRRKTPTTSASIG